MIAGYLRLSRDEDKKQYVSIENQRLILNQYAASNGWKVDVFYEDDNISGYTLERPGMKRMLHAIDAGLIDTVIAKDLSRIGRHNAKVLLLMEELKERGIRLILVNDNYDSFHTEEDDIIGIKTWYNERYVKDASRKMKKVLRARQKEGTLPVRPCFGYETLPWDKCKICVVEREAGIIKKIFELYLEGNGYRKIAEYLNEAEIPTPSYLMKQRNSKGFNGVAAGLWSLEMVRDILKNDSYTGRLRTHVRERKTIHGTDTRVPEEKQYIFENHHEPIIDQKTFLAVQEIMAGRVRNHYRGQRKNSSVFSQCIFCKDCGERMSLVRRTKRNRQTYFICRTYNTKGKNYCPAHTVDEEELLNAVFHYLKLCREILKEDGKEYTLEREANRKKQEERLLKELDIMLFKQQKKLEILLEQKISRMSENVEQAALLNDTYEKLERALLNQIKKLKDRIESLKGETAAGKQADSCTLKAAEILDQIIQNRKLTEKDVEFLIEKILVEEDGSFEINLRYGLASYADGDKINSATCNTMCNTTCNTMGSTLSSTLYDITGTLYNEKNIEKDVLLVVLEDAETKGFTSARNMNQRLKEKGWNTSPRSAASFLMRLSEEGLLQKTDNPRKPYRIAVDKEKLRRMFSEPQENR